MADAPVRTVRSDRRMSDAEALMWNLEKDPSLRSTFLNVTFLDRAPSFEGFKARIAKAVAEIPRLRQKVDPGPGRLAPPAWVDDPAFDLDFHVRRVGLPAPGTDRQLLDFAAAEFGDAFDRARPLWRYTIVEGLSDGRAAMLAKMHHTITDGVGGVRLSAMFIDLERDAPEPEQPPDAEDDLPGEEPTSLLDAIRRPFDLTRKALGDAVDSVKNPVETAQSMA